MKTSSRALVLPLVLSAPLMAWNESYAASNASRDDCDDQEIGTEAMFDCEAYTSVSPPAMGPAETYATQRQFFPQSWSQLGFNQRHNTVFDVSAEAPDFLTQGTFWAAPLTGLDFQDVKRALPSVGYNTEAWGSTTSQYVGNAVGVSVVQGITFVQTGKREIWAVDTGTGVPIWRQEVSSSASMGQALVQEVAGKLMVFVPVGDAAFTVQNAIDFANGKSHFRGANFAGLHVFDGLTGEPLWRYDTKGAQRPTPVFLDGKLYVTTNGGKMSILEAETGAELGTFTNPGNGYSGLAAPNWMDTADGRRILIYGTIRPARINGVDVTDPTAPTLAWSYTPPTATANAPGDTSIAVDPELGLAYTTVFSNTGTGASPVFDLNLIALNVETGTAAWSMLMGQGDSPPGYKGSVPMVHNGVVYTGNTLNGTYQAFDAVTGTRLWSTDLSSPNDPVGAKHRPRAASVYYDGKLIVVEGRLIHTLDAATGTEINRFQNPGFFGVWGVNQPVIVGKLAILSSVSGWVFAAPVDYLTSQPGLAEADTPAGATVPAVATPRLPVYSDPDELPTPDQVNQFDTTVLAYAGGQSHNSVTAAGPHDVEWKIPLKDAVPLDSAARDASLFGDETASHMMHIAYGAGTGVSPAAGILYVGSDRFTVDAINAVDGELIWRAETQNANFGQPLVTPGTVVVSSGDPWLNLGQTGKFKKKSSATAIGDNWANLRGYDPLTGVEKWTVYTASGSSAMTPLYNNGNLYWVSGQGKVWAVNAETGEPVVPFMNADGLPLLKLGGFNAISSANIHHQPNGQDIMVVGTAMPNKMTAIDLATATVLWTQDLATAGSTYSTGFAAVSPAVSQDDGLVVGSVLIDADTVTNTASVLAYALDAASGAVKWTRSIGSGAIPTGFVGPTPLLDATQAYFHDPIANSVYALDLATGTPVWQTTVASPDGKLSWGPGVLVDGKLIQPVGPDLVTLDAATGSVINSYHVGGSFTYNHPTVAGDTLYIGNSWGWAMAVPLSEVITGDGINNNGNGNSSGNGNGNAPQ